MTKEIRVSLSEDMHKRLKAQKGERTWKEVLVDGAEAADE